MPWEMQAGDPLTFAFKLAFTRNPHGATDRALPEDRDSWGSFSVWVDGENLCAHRENDELMSGAHWYLLPLIEWFAANWDSLFHEERLPLKNAGTSAAESMAVTKLPPLRLKDVDEFTWMDSWVAWWSRHNFRAAREGGLFPDLYLRRHRDELEISTGAEALPGVPSGFGFLWRNRSYGVDPVVAARCVHEVLVGAVAELMRGMPGSERLDALDYTLSSLADAPSRRTDRLAWLSGLGDQIIAFRQVSSAVDSAFGEVDADIQLALLGNDSGDSLVISGTPYARLLYGAISPDIDLADVGGLASALVENYVPDASSWIERLEGLHVDDRGLEALSPGEQGSRLGEDIFERVGLAMPGHPLAVDVEAVLRDLHIDVSSMVLSDTELRAVSVVGPSQKPHIYANSNFSRGGRRSSTAMHRFTLAHELCHLLFDRERGDDLAVASGPWAPMAIEQRANAFAAAFLMPSGLLREAIGTTDGDLGDFVTITSVARKLRVSVSSLVDRLFNLGELASDDRIRLRSVAQQATGRRVRRGRP